MPFDATPQSDPRLATITLIDAMLAYYVDESRWTRGGLHDGHGGRCISGAARHTRRIQGIRGDRLRHYIALSLRTRPGEPFCGLPFLNDGLSGIAEVREVLLAAREAAARTK